MKKNVKWIPLLLAFTLLFSFTLAGCSDVVYEEEYYDDEYSDESTDSSKSGASDEEDDESTQNKPSTPSTQNNQEVHDPADNVSVSSGSPRGTFFKINFGKDGNKYTGVATQSGKIVYYVEDTGAYFTYIGNNAGYVTETAGTTKKYTLITANGTKKAFDADAFDLIIGEGDGYMLVYKNTGNASRAEHSYGLLNSNGEWEKPLSPGEWCSSLVTIDTFSRFKHMGNQMFAYVEGDYCMIFDAQNNTMIDLEDYTLLSTSFHNGRFFARYSGVTYLYNRDGSRQKTEDVREASDKMAIYEKGGKLQVMNLTTNAINAYDAFPADSIYSIDCVGEYALLIIHGQDGRCYFTVIDANGQQMFEPKLCLNSINIDLYEDKILYDTTSDYDEVIDVHGNVIISQDREFTALYTGNGQTFEGHIANVGDLLLDQNGDEVTFYLPKTTSEG